MFVHIFFYICIFTCNVYTLSSKLYCIFYLRMKIIKFQRKQASLKIIQKCVTPLVEIPMSLTKIHGNPAWVFLEHKFYFSLIEPWNLQFLTIIRMRSSPSAYHKPVSVVTFNRGRSSLLGKKSVFSNWKYHPLSEDRKFKSLLCMSLVFCASRNVSFNDSNHILKFFTKGFENLPSSFFLIPKICYQVLSKACGCIYTLSFI